MSFGTPSLSKVPPPPPAPGSPVGSAAAKGAKVKAESAFGPGRTIMTGPQGLTKPASTAGAKLLGE